MWPQGWVARLGGVSEFILSFVTRAEINERRMRQKQKGTKRDGRMWWYRARTNVYYSRGFGLVRCGWMCVHVSIEPRFPIKYVINLLSIVSHVCTVSLFFAFSLSLLSFSPFIRAFVEVETPAVVDSLRISSFLWAGLVLSLLQSYLQMNR